MNLNIDPAKLQIAKDILSNYTEDNKLKKFNIIHLYPNYETKLKDNDCYNDCLKFTAVIYNTKTNKFRTLGNYHDQLNLIDCNTFKVLPLDILRIFADGSIVIRFTKIVQLPFNKYLQVIELTTENV